MSATDRNNAAPWELRLEISELEDKVDKLEAENASLQKQNDQLADDLARARKEDL
jgi:FtsZ-binding cell division protein ZapB